MRNMNYLALLIAGIALQSCSSEKGETTRTKIAGGDIEYSIPAQESELPTIELMEVEEGGLSLSSCPAGDKACKQQSNQDLWDLLLVAGQQIKSGVYSGNNVFAAGVAWSNRDGKTVSRCVKIQIQERKSGKIIVKNTLTPAGQAEECKTDSLNGLSVATLGLFVKVAGNNYAAGVGIGAVLYSEPYIVGCAAGAVGYASETYQTSYATAGAFCTQIYDVTTGATY